MHFKRATIRPLQRLADAAGQMNVGRTDYKTVFHMVDSHDPVQRMFNVFGRFLVADKANDLGSQALRYLVQRQDAAR